MGLWSWSYVKRNEYILDLRSSRDSGAHDGFLLVFYSAGEFNVRQ